MSFFKDLEKKYNEKQNTWKMKIRLIPNRFKRFWNWVWYFIAFPFVWLFYNIRDWRSLVCVIISFLLWSSSVWLFYLLAFITGWNTTTGKWFFGIGSAVWVWWLSPVGSPFILLVTFTAIAMKMLFNKIKSIRKKKKKPDYSKCPYKLEPADANENPEYIPPEER